MRSYLFYSDLDNSAKLSLAQLRNSLFISHRPEGALYRQYFVLICLLLNVSINLLSLVEMQLLLDSLLQEFTTVAYIRVDIFIEFSKLNSKNLVSYFSVTKVIYLDLRKIRSKLVLQEINF